MGEWKESLNVLDLFSGIGGFSLGLERAGMRTVAFCERDPYCQRVLRKHWPAVPVWGDVRALTVHDGWLVADADERRKPPQEQLCAGRQSIGDIDLTCGGFPCQDISLAGRGAGIAGERSGLWSEFARIIGEVRPRYVIVENVAALLGRGLGRVLGDLAALGYDAEWHCIPACAVGAPHRRDRVWIVAYGQIGGCGKGRPRRSVGVGEGIREQASSAEMAYASGARLALGPGTLAEWAHGPTGRGDWWLVEPDVGRVAHGVPARVDRLRGLGNALVPQIAEVIGRAIMEREFGDDGARGD